MVNGTNHYQKIGTVDLGLQRDLANLKSLTATDHLDIKNLTTKFYDLEKELYNEKRRSIQNASSEPATTLGPDKIAGLFQEIGALKEENKLLQSHVSLIAESLRKKREAEKQVVDVVTGYVDDVEGDLVYAKFTIGEKTDKAVFSRSKFAGVGADFCGARVRFLTVKTADPINPYDLEVELMEKQPLQKLTADILKQLEQLEDLEHDG